MARRGLTPGEEAKVRAEVERQNRAIVDRWVKLSSKEWLGFVGMLLAAKPKAFRRLKAAVEEHDTGTEDWRGDVHDEPEEPPSGPKLWTPGDR